MYWRILAAILLLVGASYFVGKRQHISVVAPVAAAAATPQQSEITDEKIDNDAAEELAFAPSTAAMPGPIVAAEILAAPVAQAEPVKRYSLNIQQESLRIAAAAGVSIAAISTTDKLPPQSPMAMTYRRGSCVLLVNSALPLDGLILNNLTIYGQRQLTFTLGHETGHCYMLTHIAQRDPAIIGSLSPPGKSYGFEQYIAMMGNYSDYPDLNRWNEEWADAFSAFILNRAYGREFATSVTSERYSLRKDQEKSAGVLTANVYGGHGSLTEDALFTIQSPTEIANLVKLGRLNTSR
jgi:hypothetical protein